MAILPESRAAVRVCLKCNRRFDSFGPGNRICPKCTCINNRINVSEASLARQRGVKRHNGDPQDPLELRDAA